MRWSTRIRSVAGAATLLSGLLSVLPVHAQQALVLGGGGSRGLAHAGVIVGLEERGWDPDLVVGTSIGAIMGSLYAAGMPADSIWDVATRLDWRLLFQYVPQQLTPGRMGAYPLTRLGIAVDRARYAEGLISDFRVNRVLVRLLFDAATRAQGDFDRLPRAFRAVAADLATGEAVVLGDGDLAHAVRASMAVPGVFAPVLRNGRTLVDGGVANHLPADVARELGFTRVVGVDVVRPRVDTTGLSPLRAAVRASRLVLIRAAAPDATPDILILPDLDPDQTSSIFPRDPTALLVVGREAALEQAPGVPSRPPRVRTPGALPVQLASMRVDVADPGLHDLVEERFRAALGAYDPERVLDAADALYATGLFHGIWPRVVLGGVDSVGATLVVRADAIPPLTLAGGAAYENDRGGRLWLQLRARPGLAATELLMGGMVDGMMALGAAGVRRPFSRVPELALSAEARIQRSDVRRFDADDRAELHVRREGGAVGLEWRTLEPDWMGGLWLQSEHITVPGGVKGLATGPYVRIGRVEELSRVVGVTPLIEAEARFGDVEYRRVRVRGSLDWHAGPVVAALLFDATASTRATPVDAQPALGDDRLVPGLEWGRARAPVRVGGGIDLAVPLVLDAWARLRARTGVTGEALDDVDTRRWLPGAELGIAWWTPIGRIEGGVGIARRGRPRIDVSIGSVF